MVPALGFASAAPDRPLREGDTRERFIEAQPAGPLNPPVYPAVLVKAKAGWATLGIKIVIDTTGRVSSVETAPTVPSLPGAHEPEFMAAIEAAVQQWRFRPGEIETDEAERGPDGRLYWAPISFRPTASFTLLAFTFTADGETILGDR